MSCDKIWNWTRRVSRQLTNDTNLGIYGTYLIMVYVSYKIKWQLDTLPIAFVLGNRMCQCTVQVQINVST